VDVDRGSGLHPATAVRRGMGVKEPIPFARGHYIYVWLTRRTNGSKSHWEIKRAHALLFTTSGPNEFRGTSLITFGDRYVLRLVFYIHICTAYYICEAAAAGWFGHVIR